MNTDKKYDDKDIRATNLIINELAEKYGALSEPMVAMRAIWNIFTNANKERKRCRNIIGKMLRKEQVVAGEWDQKLFNPIEDADLQG